MNELLSTLESIKSFLWNGPLLVLLLGVGIYQTIRLRGIQFRKLFRCFAFLHQNFKKQDNLVYENKKSEQEELKSQKELSSENEEVKLKGDIPPFQSLMTSLAGSIGTGSITGVSLALATGGVGSLFWMWVMAFIGMATAYSETVLGIKYRQNNSRGQMSGGAMYTLKNGMRSKHLGTIYALIVSIAVIGIGCMTQSNSVVDALSVVVEPINCFPDLNIRLIMGIILALLLGLVMIGGVKAIGRVSGILVPFMGIAYITASLMIIIININNLPSSFKLIIESAFSGQAAAGGFLGSSFLLAVQNGIQYGIFANEAGWGTLSIAGASAKIADPVEQGMLSISGVFLATMVICTLTGLVLTITNSIGSEVNGVVLSGSPLAMLAYGKDIKFLKYIVVLGLSLFAFTTMIAWGYYGEKCSEFLFGIKSVKIYKWIFTISVVLGAVMKLELVWAIANLFGGLMTIPNLISVIFLSKVVVQETNRYFNSKN